jgi:thymidine phosphorylase
MLLGAGRARLDTAIDLGVGLTVHARIGDKLERDSPLSTIHFNDAARAEEAAGDIRSAYTIGPQRVEPPQLIKAVLR